MNRLFCFFLLLVSVNTFAQQENPYGLKVLGLKEYAETVKADSNNKLVNIQQSIPGIKLDIRYAGKNNFTGTAVYDQEVAYARLPVVNALAEVQKELKKQGLGLKIYDAYRPYSVTVKFFEIASDKNFVANPKKGSRHNRGCAVDLTLVKLKNGKELKMPTEYDSFAAEASPDNMDLPKKVIKNRDLLIAEMKKQGFTVLYNEWWHFDFKTWKQFEIMDIPFKEL
ncbi:MAG: M15 family metallopeptidase [Daejeonella sp.]